MLAYDYPLLGAFWTVFWIFIWIMWIFLLFRVIVDIFRSHDMGGFAKAIWLIVVLIAPFLGVFIYVIAVAAAWASETWPKPRPGTSSSTPMYVRPPAAAAAALPMSWPSWPTSASAA